MKASSRQPLVTLLAAMIVTGCGSLSGPPGTYLPPLRKK